MRLIINISILILTLACSSNITQYSNINDKEYLKHIELGLPTDKDTSDDYIIYRKQYVLSYNINKGVANWVSWQLTKDDYGAVKRYKGLYITDTLIPINKRINHYDYSNSGYDRGHIVRSEERTKTIEDNQSTFILTNIMPQLNKLNSGAWLDLENHCKKLCFQKNSKLFIIAGGVFKNNKSLKNLNKVMIPDYFFKIIVVLKSNQSNKDINANTQIISVLMPNNESELISNKYTDYIATIDSIESLTGYNYLSNLSLELQNIIEKR